MTEKLTREFKLSTASINNKNTIYLIILVIIVFGAIAYSSLPKALFPDINIPTVLVQTTYPGNSPEDIENLISKIIEKEVKTVKGITKLTSTSAQDASMIFVEFETGTDIKQAMQDIKDEVDKVKGDLPNDLPFDPLITDIDLSEFPVININLYGDYSLDQLKKFAEYLQDDMETIPEVSKADIKGVSEKEIQINIDPYKLEANFLAFSDVENAIAAENVTISGGEIKMGKNRRSIRAIGEFKNVKEIENIIVKYLDGEIVYLKDIAQVKETFKEAESFARLNDKTVVSLQVIKKGGENLLSAIDQVYAKLELAKKKGILPADIGISITNNQSKIVKSQLSNLENSMIIGMIFVIGVLFFFLGLRNALLVGFAIPMSMLLSFTVLGLMGVTINMMVLFALVLALGMLVDNAIVVVENIYRFIDEGYSVYNAVKNGVGEVAWPIISSTATTLAAFLPLAFWGGIMGEFMKYLPITLIIVLTASLFVALVLVPVLAQTFINKEALSQKPKKRLYMISLSIAIALSILLYATHNIALANIIMLFVILFITNILFFFNVSQWFQNVVLVKLENGYSVIIGFTLRGKMPYTILGGTTFLLFASIVFMGARDLNMLFFPNSEPQYINVIAEFPIGTDVTTTDSIVKMLEKDITKILQPNKKIVESILTTVGSGAARENDFAVGNTPNKAISTIKFIDFEFREGISTSDIMKQLMDKLPNSYAGIEIFVEKNSEGPPTGAPINIEIAGDDMDKLVAITDSLIVKIENSGIKGIEKLKINVETGKPEIILHIDRDKARRFGLSTGQVASTVRTALFGKEISDFKTPDDEYPIQLRLAEEFRYNLSALMNQNIVFRNQKGQLVKIPISAVADISYSSSYGAIKRKDMTRVITLFSNVVEGYNANRINAELKSLLKNFTMPDNYTIAFTGEQEEQQKTMTFLINALLIAIALIAIILVSQFNSFAKPLIIIASIVFSTIGVFGGLATFKMDIVILMTGIGIVSLAGVVVNNAIVLIDYIDFLKANRKNQLGLEPEDNLELSEITPLLMQAGKTRLRPVLLTAITTILGLVPMAIGLNINFVTLFTEFDPQIYFGGDNAMFWSPMAWTVIFGLTFATFLTLVVVPAMYLIANKVKLHFVKK